MSDTKIDTAEMRFASRAFPTREEMVRWNALSPEEQRAIIERDEEAGFQSGIAAHESLEDRLARVRASARNAL